MNTIIITAIYSIMTERLSFRTETSMLKAAYLKPFSNESVKAKIFIL